MAATDGVLNDSCNADLSDSEQSGTILWVANFGLSTQTNDFSAALDFIRQLKHPIISDARKQKAVALYQKWGSYGWTPDPDGVLYPLFKTEPLNRLDADARARKHFRDMSPVFDAIRNRQRVKKHDLEEAIVNFDGKRYKSCAMMLFSLIDAQLIRLQKSGSNARRRREVGASAVREARKRSGVDEHDEWLIAKLEYVNLFSCLDVMFENGRDFRHQPEVINRNYLAHGMMRREVTRTSCIQLFLLYYNMLEMLDLIYFKWQF